MSRFRFFLKFVVKAYAFIFLFCSLLTAAVFFFNSSNQEDFDLWYVILWFRYHPLILIVLVLTIIPGIVVNWREQRIIPKNPRW
jgi:hypothetical protein